MDKIRSIAVPVTRRAATKAVRRAGHPQIAPDQMVGGTVGGLRQPPRAMRPATHHRYRVGQRLRMLGGSSVGRGSGTCKIIALLPHEGGPLLYRVKSEAEGFERVVAEADLSLPDLP